MRSGLEKVSEGGLEKVSEEWVREEEERCGECEKSGWEDWKRKVGESEDTSVECVEECEERSELQNVRRGASGRGERERS